MYCDRKTTLCQYKALIESNIKRNESVYTAHLLCSMLTGIFEVITWVLIFQGFLVITVFWGSLRRDFTRRGQIKLRSFFKKKFKKFTLIFFMFSFTSGIHFVRTFEYDASISSGAKLEKRIMSSFQFNWLECRLQEQTMWKFKIDG